MHQGHTGGAIFSLKMQCTSLHTIETDKLTGNMRRERGRNAIKVPGYIQTGDFAVT